MLFNGIIFGNSGSNECHQKPDTNPETWYVNEKFLVMLEYYISVESF